MRVYLRDDDIVTRPPRRSRDVMVPDLHQLRKEVPRSMDAQDCDCSI